jgi:hypothetical protein
MGKVLEMVRKGCKSVDCFSTRSFIRYQGEEEYRTATGGVCSLLIVVAFCLQFLTVGSQTLERSIIKSAVEHSVEVSPSQLKVSASVEGGFMFAFLLLGFNLNDPQVKLFDIVLKQVHYSPIMKVISETEIPL